MTCLADRTPLVLAALLFLGTGWTFVVKSGFVTADDPNQMLTDPVGGFAGGNPRPGPTLAMGRADGTSFAANDRRIPPGDRWPSLL